ncbi:hypothetical protein DV515_00009674 [Chloebia gouldiae]|uniref:Ubiquitin-like domain-containing protein n=1 Tax=Chloebia gouldiae TaxID=44316 RepID=A0A3L8SBB1_CHLGU|nr:hypothetical protein DV515_00009674 [Chloebia gouldiae]
MQVKEIVRQMCELLKKNRFEDNIYVQKTVKEQKNNRKAILDLIMMRLKVCKESVQFPVSIGEPRYKGPDSMPHSLRLTLSSRETRESIDVDIMPAYDALGQVTQDAPPNAEAYVRLLHACSHPGEFSLCFTKLQKMFVKRCPAKLKNLLRLVKFWYKEYALELLTIYAWEEATGSASSFDIAQGFRTVLELLCWHREICIYWEKYYSLQHREIGAHVKRLLRSPHPVILDPADPTGIPGQDKNWDVMAHAGASYCCSLPFLASVQPWKVQPARPMTIEVMQLSGTRMMERVSPYITIGQLKKMIQQNWGILPYTQCLAQQTEPQKMQVFVKGDKNWSTTYMVLPTDTVRQLKEQIQAQESPSPSEQDLTFGSRELEDQHML